MPIAFCDLAAVNVVKNVLSVGILGASMVVIGYGIGNGLALLPGPAWLHFIILIAAVTLLGYLEGLQVAVLALENLDYTVYRDQYPNGARLMDRAVLPEGVKQFLCGRQFFVVFVVFIVAQLTTFPDFPVGHLPTVVKIVVIDTGLCGALFVLMWGQLLPQITASDCPIQFCNLPGARAVLYLCLGFEHLGITDVSWLLAGAIRYVTKPNGLLYRKREMRSPAAADSLSNPLLDFQKDGYIQNTNDDYSEIHWESVFATAQANKDKPAPILKSNMAGFPSAEELCRQMLARGEQIPRFLLPATHPLHIPPHLVCAQMLNKLAPAAKQFEHDGRPTRPNSGPSLVIT
eukprot:gb/GEZN01010295.1/.p1 GENE.gb/GEZN01010295.1/~~gb/GEZN01010295.1/.p1  ORF type:complete len:346 (-),score=51.03 gb/GEZN01010295.1/:161-1198(-)